ncbi:NURS complex subunit red1 [Cladobotryum mycophilum]|uniref:NURS complex subunit red1 n=1 Tax=Cladobotryum mycophilum TaxID=491253 RepID=A0ABR0SFW6_9HYPO
MAQSGYGYDPMRSYPPQALYASQPYSSYTIPSHRSNEPTQPTAATGEATKEPYNHNRNVIPGLGLGFSNSGSDRQGNRVGAISQHPSVMEIPSSRTVAPGMSRVVAVEARVEPATDAIAKKGRLGDVYEPREVENTVVMSNTLQGKKNHIFPGDVYMDGSNPASPAAQPIARERSGSYSPYLSPREINQIRSSDSQIDAHGTTSHQKASLIARSIEPVGHVKAAQATSQVSNFLHVHTVAEARKQAQDAILRLWPLNVRYQNYLDEGIDDGLLESLFKELGFDIGVNADMEVANPRKNSSAKSSDASVREPDAANKNQISEAQPDKAPKQDKSEERKDRIARLLAAKSSKAGSSAPPTTTTPDPTNKPAAQAKNQSEKSKLLYQKMEALKKAREARGLKRSLPEEPTTPAPTSTITAHTIPLDAVNDAPRDSSVPQGQISDASPSANGQPTPSIPGLFLSSTPQPSPVQDSTPRHQSAPTNVESAERPFKRPFGQTRESRPFLIDVSDDEDDAEMDIDSPEHNSSSIHRPVTPSMRTASFKGTSSFMENGLVRQYSSPIHTPSGMTSDGSARDDLENMNKKIEAMKRKIAEAEARKKAKQSRPQSPALTPLTVHAQDDSFESTASAIDATIRPQSSASIPLPDSRSSSQPISDMSPMRLPKVADARHEFADPKRRSLSRAANERLPMLEARRREQQLKLRLLQSQMASIEKDIQDSLQEEERLKEDAVNTESDAGEEDDIPTEPLALAKATEPSSIEAMDTTSSSSSSSEDIERSRNTTPGPVQESSEKPTRDAISSPPPTSPRETQSDVGNASASKPMADAANEISTAVTEMVEMQPQSRVTTRSESHDVVMQEVDSDEELEDASDSYEPPEADSSSSSSENSRASSPFSPAPAEQSINDSKNEMPDTATTLPVTQQISRAHEASAPEAGREADHATEAPTSEIPHTGFVPYETPLQYFHAYRFHPEFSKSVTGGLRSLTYSNKIDVKRELCPDELAGQNCPRGKECEYQHFETMQAPDDQILLQLGAYGNYDEKHKQEYISGLRQLLTEFRNNKVKDFKAISQGIIDYRAQFLKDKSKILPLGNVTI